MSRPAAVELLAALAAVSRRRRRRWYVFGAQAAVAYGRPRLTADVDVTVEASDVPALIAELEAGGFRLRLPAAQARLTVAHVVPLVHVGTAMPLDLVIAGPGLEEQFLARAAGASPWVASGYR